MRNKFAVNLATTRKQRRWADGFLRGLYISSERFPGHNSSIYAIKQSKELRDQTTNSSFKRVYSHEFASQISYDWCVLCSLWLSMRFSSKKLPIVFRWENPRPILFHLQSLTFKVISKFSISLLRPSKFYFFLTTTFKVFILFKFKALLLFSFLFFYVNVFNFFILKNSSIFKRRSV